MTKKTGARVAAPPAATASAAAFHLVSGDAVSVSPTARALNGAGLLHTLEDVLESGLFPGDPTDDAADLVSTASPTAQQVAHLMTGRAPRPVPVLPGDPAKPSKGAASLELASIAERRADPSRQLSWADLALGAYLVVAAGWSMAVLDGRHAFFLAFQGGAFLAAGLDLVGDPS